MTPITLIIILFLALAVIALLVVVLKKSNHQPKEAENNIGLQLILEQINELSRTVDQKISDSQDKVNESLRYSSQSSQSIIRDITERLTRLDETNKQVIGFTDQLKSLQDMLKNPKQRGVLGEYFLETLLKNTLPSNSYAMQFTLGTDDDGNTLIPDAVVFVKEKIIPIDSKFSLENYNRIIEATDKTERDRLEKVFVNDLKNRIAETAKYIKPENGTMDFAFMFIPHEAIYYDLLINKVGAITDDTENLIQRAASKYRVIIVSPTSFLAYLQTVLQGLKALQIEEKALDIIKRVEELGRHLKAYEEYHGKLGSSLGTVINHYNTSGKELKKIDKDVLRITGEAVGLDIPLLDKPEKEDQ